MKKILLSLLVVSFHQTYADIYHVVSFRFKADKETQKLVPAAVKAFEALETLSVDPKDSSRELIKLFRHGVNNSTEQLSFGKKGLKADRASEHTFLMTFDSIEDRDYYVDKDPEHAKFKKLVGPLLEGGAEGVFVTDFED